MEQQFNWALREMPRWTPSSKFGPYAVVIDDDLLRVSDDVYLMVNKSFGADEKDPAVGALLWAQSREAALLIYAYLIPDAPVTPAAQQPPADVLGFHPATYGTVVEYHRSRGERVQEQADYRFTDGRFTHTVLSCGDRHYCFASLNPEAGEGVIGVRFDLPAD